MLFPRIMTAVIGAPLVLAAVWFGGLPFFFLLLGVVFLCLREFYYLAEENGYPTFSWMGVGSGVLMVVSIFLNGTAFANVTENQFTAALLSLIILALAVRSLTRGPSETLLSEWGVTFFGIMFVAWPLGHLFLIRDLRPQGQTITFLLITIIWVSDIVAYVVGTQLGRRPIALSISPKKTWEGTIAGLIAAMMVAVGFQTTALRTQLKLPEALFLGLAVGILAFASDLSESLLKRAAGQKDSSSLLPGHGGVLDRFDSFLLTAPLYYYYWAFLKH
jgi:phosphatidate cytidylyltransferase